MPSTPTDGQPSDHSISQEFFLSEKAWKTLAELYSGFSQKLDEQILSLSTAGGPVESNSEVRATDPETGGQKGRKPEEYAFIPPGALAEVARVYGMGAEKYDPWNWAKGYPYSWSLSALYRHVEAFRRGEETDSESGLPHLAHAAFHLFTLMEFRNNNLGTDDRWKP